MELGLLQKRNNRHRPSLQRRSSNKKQQPYYQFNSGSLQRRKSTNKNLLLKTQLYKFPGTTHRNSSNSHHHNNHSHHNDSEISLRKKSLVDSSSSNFVKAKTLYKQFRLEEATREFEKVLASDPEHLEAMYLLGISQLNIHQLNQASKTFQKLISVTSKQHHHSNPSYRLNVYLFAAICYNKLKHPEKALHSLGIALSRNPDYLEALCYRGKIYIGMRKFSKAEEDFDAALMLQPQKQVCLIGKADALRGKGLGTQAIKYYTRALQKGQNNQVLFKRAICYFQCNLLDQCQKDISKLLQSEENGEVLYYQGLLHLAYNNQALAIMSFQQAAKTTSANTKTAIKCCEQIIKLKISACDFYECTSVLNWAANLGLAKGLQHWRYFVDAVVCLMKKKYAEADDSFKHLQATLSQEKDHYLFPLSKLYRGYGFFCLHKYEQAYDYFSEYQRYITVVLGKEIDPKAFFNKILSEALMLCECEFYEESVAKLEQLINLAPAKSEPYFYKAMVYVKVGFSDTPYLHSYQTKGQILGKALQILQNSQPLSQNPLVHYFCSLIKCYFGNIDQAEKLVTKAIEKGEDHLADFFHLRSLINSLLGKRQQALSDISVSLNIEERGQFYLDRCRLHQLDNRAEEAYADLQKYIEIEPNQQQVSKWACIILFSNKAFTETEKTLMKIDMQHNQLKPVIARISLMNGNFSQGGLEGQLIESVMSRTNDIDIDKILLTQKKGYGYLTTEYIYYLRAVKHYLAQNFSAAIKDLQIILFLLKDHETSEMLIEARYSILVCHLLNGDREKANSLASKGLTAIAERLVLINNLDSLRSIEIDDLGEFIPDRHLSEFLPFYTLPNSNKVKIKISVPYPEFPPLNSLTLRLTDQHMIRAFTLEAVQGKGQAPWIRKSESGTYQFTSKIESNSVSLQTSRNVSILL